MEAWKLRLEIEAERWKSNAHRDKSKQTRAKLEGSDNLSESELRVRNKYFKIVSGTAER